MHRHSFFLVRGEFLSASSVDPCIDLAESNLLMQGGFIFIWHWHYGREKQGAPRGFIFDSHAVLGF